MIEEGKLAKDLSNKKKSDLLSMGSEPNETGGPKADRTPQQLVEEVQAGRMSKLKALAEMASVLEIHLWEIPPSLKETVIQAEEQFKVQSKESQMEAKKKAMNAFYALAEDRNKLMPDLSAKNNPPEEPFASINNGEEAQNNELDSRVHYLEL